MIDSGCTSNYRKHGSNIKHQNSKFHQTDFFNLGNQLSVKQLRVIDQPKRTYPVHNQLKKQKKAYGLK